MTRPDIVLIHCHDLGRWLSAYDMGVPTPRLQEFADRAIVFDNAHSLAPLCSPARGSLFTGISPHRHGVQGLSHYGWRYRQGVVTMPERLSAAGYRTTLIGLQHENSDPTVLGFDEVLGTGFLPRVNSVVDAATAWLDRLDDREDRDPAFLTVGVWEVHRPWPSEDYTPADPASVEVPAYLPDNRSTRDDIAAFHGSIAQLDSGIGELLDHIDRRLDPSTTMVVFTTDHGVAFPRAKGTLYDAGTGVSLIVRPPTSWTSAPGRRSQMVTHMDLLPTFIEVSETSQPEGLEGSSLVSLLRSGIEDHERRIVTSKSYHNAFDPIRAVRSERFAYIRNFQPGPLLVLAGDIEASLTRNGMGDDHLAPRPDEEFYDRSTDPDELVNMVGSPDYAETRDDFAETLEAWMKDTLDPMLTEGTVSPPPPRSREIDALPPLVP